LPHRFSRPAQSAALAPLHQSRFFARFYVIPWEPASPLPSLPRLLPGSKVAPRQSGPTEGDAACPFAAEVAPWLSLLGRPTPVKPPTGRRSPPLCSPDELTNENKLTNENICPIVLIGR